MLPIVLLSVVSAFSRFWTSADNALSNDLMFAFTLLVESILVAVFVLLKSLAVPMFDATLLNAVDISLPLSAATV